MVKTRRFRVVWRDLSDLSRGVDLFKDSRWEDNLWFGVHSR